MDRRLPLCGFLLYFLALTLTGGCATQSLFNFAVRGSTHSTAPDARLSLSAALGWAARETGRAVGDTASLRVPINAFYVSVAADCSLPQVVIDYGGDPLAKDFTEEPVLFSGRLEPGEFACAIIQISDTVSFRPDAAAAEDLASCDKDQSYAVDLFPEGADAAGKWKDIGDQDLGALGTVGTPSTQFITLFFSQDPHAVREARGLPADQARGLPDPFVVPGEVVFYADFSGKVSEAGGKCVLEGGTSRLGIR